MPLRNLLKPRQNGTVSSPLWTEGSRLAARPPVWHWVRVSTLIWTLSTWGEHIEVKWRSHRGHSHTLSELIRLSASLLCSRIVRASSFISSYWDTSPDCPDVTTWLPWVDNQTYYQQRIKSLLTERVYHTLQAQGVRVIVISFGSLKVSFNVSGALSLGPCTRWLIVLWKLPIKLFKLFGSVRIISQNFLSIEFFQ